MYRPIPFYYLTTTMPGELDLAAARKAMKSLRSGGYGGAVLFNKPPTGFDPEEYLSDFWFETIENFLIAAQEEKLRIWINDGWDYPPGGAGNRIQRIAPGLKQQRLEQVAAVDGRSAVRVCECDWGFPAFEEPRSSELFIELVYEEYFRRLGRYFNAPIVGFFSDADNRRIMPNHQDELRGKIVYPWSRNFSRQFAGRFGYEITPFLPDILSGGGGEAAGHYWQLASELYQQWFANNFDWCRKHGLKYSFHTSDTGPFTARQCQRTSVFCEGETLRLAGFCDYPGTDHELALLDGGTHYDRRYVVPAAVRGGGCVQSPTFAATRYDLRAKYIASAALLHRKERTLCECFAGVNWGASFSTLRRIVAWQLMQGIDFFVPAAVHHRICGITKYFAPPGPVIFADHPGIRALNDFIAKWAMIASQGEYPVDLTLPDPTRKIWTGGDAGELFEHCDRLNRKGLNYLIVPPGTGSENGKTPPERAGFSGGELAYMRRKLPGGAEYLLVANVWSEAELTGTLWFDGRTVEIALAPGEMAAIGGPFEEFRRPAGTAGENVQLGAADAVRWGAPNLVPFHRPGAWSSTGDLPGMRLSAPKHLAGKVRFDGRLLTGGVATAVWDDEYVEYPIPGAAGEHRLEFPETPWELPVLLSGEFDVDYAGLGPEKEVFACYSMKFLAPEAEKIRLSPRRKRLAFGSWADQGQPFYSGRCEYVFEFTGSGFESELFLAEVAASCRIELDGRDLGAAFWPPYRFDLGVPSKERHRLTIGVESTLANRMEEHRAPSGLLQAPVISCRFCTPAQARKRYDEIESKKAEVLGVS